MNSKEEHKARRTHLSETAFNQASLALIRCWRLAASARSGRPAENQTRPALTSQSANDFESEGTLKAA